MSTRSWPQKDSEQVWFGVQIIGGLYAIGGLRENRVGLGWLPQHSRPVQFTQDCILGYSQPSLRD